jgi:hypothetical protein
VKPSSNWFLPLDWMKCGSPWGAWLSHCCTPAHVSSGFDRSAALLPQALKDSPGAASFQLDPYSQSETEQYLAQRLGDFALAGDQMAMLAAAVWGKTAGLPLYVDQMAAHLHDQVSCPAMLVPRLCRPKLPVWLQ